MDLVKDPEFKQWFTDLKARIRQSQIKAQFIWIIRLTLYFLVSHLPS